MISRSLIKKTKDIIKNLDQLIFGEKSCEHYHLTSPQHTEITTFFGSTDITGTKDKPLRTSGPAILPEKRNDEQSPLFLHNTTIVNNSRQTGKTENGFRAMMGFPINSKSVTNIIFISINPYLVKQCFMDWVKYNYNCSTYDRMTSGSNWIDIFYDHGDDVVTRCFYFFSLDNVIKNTRGREFNYIVHDYNEFNKEIYDHFKIYDNPHQYIIINE